MVIICFQIEYFIEIFYARAARFFCSHFKLLTSLLVTTYNSQSPKRPKVRETNSKNLLNFAETKKCSKIAAKAVYLLGNQLFLVVLSAVCTQASLRSTSTPQWYAMYSWIYYTRCSRPRVTVAHKA